MTPEMLNKVVDLLPTARSFRDIAAILGTDQRIVSKAAKPFLAIMQINGTHPVCECGRLRFHPYACAANKGAKPWTHQPYRSTHNHTVRDRVVPLLVAGLSGQEVAAIAGIKHESVKWHARNLTPEQRAQRARANPKAIQPPRDVPETEEAA